MNKVKHEINIEYGSDFQKSFGESVIKGMIDAIKDHLENSHKKNKIGWVIYENDAIKLTKNHGEIKREENRVIFAPPVMSWDKPIEREILEFVTSMERQMQVMEDSGMACAEHYVNAYRTVKEHIKREIKLRELISTQSKEGEE